MEQLNIETIIGWATILLAILGAAIKQGKASGTLQAIGKQLRAREDGTCEARPETETAQLTSAISTDVLAKVQGPMDALDKKLDALDSKLDELLELGAQRSARLLVIEQHLRLDDDDDEKKPAVN